MSERRIKRPSFRDVAGMIRSFHYVSYAVLYGHVPGIIAGAGSNPQLERWALYWYAWVSAIFLKGYFDALENVDFVPHSKEERRILYDCYVLDKALLEVQWELENRPDWVRIPVHGILEQLA